MQFELPPELIAQRPCQPRDAARMMVLHRDSGQIEHRVFRDLPSYLRCDDCLVLNKTKVLAARFEARRATGGRLEGLFIAEESHGTWRVLMQGAGRLRDGETLRLISSGIDSKWTMTMLRRLERGECAVRVEPAEAAEIVLEQIGTMPLPPYIRRQDATCETTSADRNDYQTVYAEKAGAVAAPTAGLHFTPELLEHIGRSGVRIAEVILHVGLGTFQPIEVDELADHRMHREQFELDERASDAIRASREAGGRIVAVGTTSVRVLETCAAFPPGQLHSATGHGSTSRAPISARSGWTDIFIYPPYEFRAVNVLITNFHLPGSTLLALVCAFAGTDLVFRAYREAISRQYRFYSYGDAMLIM